MKAIFPVAIAFVLSGCGANVPINRISDPSVLQAASNIVAFRKGQLEQVPLIARTLGPVEGHSCQNKFWDKVSEEDALQQAKLKALELGANGIVELRYDWSGTELARNCWKSVTASGVAVVFEK